MSESDGQRWQISSVSWATRREEGKQNRKEKKRQEGANRALIWCRSGTGMLSRFSCRHVKMWKIEKKNKRKRKIMPLHRDLFWEPSVLMSNSGGKAEELLLNPSEATSRPPEMSLVINRAFYLRPFFFASPWSWSARESLVRHVCQMFTLASRFVLSPLHTTCSPDGERRCAGARQKSATTGSWCHSELPGGVSLHLHPHRIKLAHDAWGKRAAAADLPSLSEPTSREAPSALLKPPCWRNLL